MIECLQKRGSQPPRQRLGAAAPQCQTTPVFACSSKLMRSQKKGFSPGTSSDPSFIVTVPIISPSQPVTNPASLSSPISAQTPMP